ncbi:hypothetical protein C806_03188 [Lachnospiraceae bacterium 3-1]|nr:hypothetical protein C806_03188 [Lachnospiraceae bacterium 3-1]
MRLYVIRHGATQGNRERRYVGRTDEEILESEKERLRQKIPYFPQMDMVFVSPYLRCRQTAEILFFHRLEEGFFDSQRGKLPELEMVSNPNVEIVEDLREMDFGAFEYRNYQELAGNSDYQAFIDNGGTTGFPGGEDLGVFKERCCQAFLACIRKASENRWQQIGFVVHGGTIMAVLEAFSDPPKDYYDCQVGNGCGYIIDLEIEREERDHVLLSHTKEKFLEDRENIKLKIKEEIR